MTSFWNKYWFSPSPCFDLAVVRIIACIGALYYAWFYRDFHAVVDGLAALPDQSYDPLLIFKLLNAPFGWGIGPDGVWQGRPDGGFVSTTFTVCIVAGILSTIGLLTRVSLAVFAITYTYVQAYIYAFGDFHHPSSVMIVALTAMVLSPAGRVLSVDSLFRKRDRDADPLDVMDNMAGWPIKLVMWFFALMYWSAVFSKSTRGGLDWANGYTLQWYLARAGIAKGGEFGLWIAQFHYLILATQILVLLFQATFFLCILFPKLRWIYAPAGFLLHVSIYLTLQAHFFTWLALYAVFVPWAAFAKRLRGTTYAAAP